MHVDRREESCENSESLSIFSKNAFISDDDKLKELMGEPHDLDWDVMCFSETRAKDDLIDLD